MLLSQKNHVLLSESEEYVCSQQIEDGDKAAYQNLIEANIKLVLKIAHSYQSRNCEVEDLIQEGCIGLLTAAKKYDHRHKVRFSTYASLWIKQSIGRALSNIPYAVRMPTRHNVTMQQVNFAVQELYSQKNIDASSSDIADFLNTTESDINEVLNAYEGTSSLDGYWKEETPTQKPLSLYDLYADTSYAPEKELSESLASPGLDASMQKLNSIEHKVICHRYGLFNCEKLCLSQLGQMLGKCDETIRNIEKRALAKLRKYLGSDSE